MASGTVYEVIAGGALIGFVLALLRVLTGRVMSTSGMIGSLLGGREGLAAASIAFLAGVVISPLLPLALGFSLLPPAEASWTMLVIGGVLVGFGARLGHSGLVGSLFGMARGSRPALVAALALAAGTALSLVLRQVLGQGGVA